MADKKHFETVTEYIASFPKEIQDSLEEIRKTIQKTAPEATETISYQIPTFKHNGKYLVYYSAWKDHFSIYPVPAGDDDFRKEIAPYVTGKGTISFPFDRPVPYNLIKKIVEFHIIDEMKNH